MKQVTLRRWEVVVAFVAITLSFVIGLTWLSHVSDQQHKLIVANHELIVAQRHLSAARVKDRKRTDVTICRKIDRLDVALLKVVGSPRPALRPGQYGYDYWVHHPQEKLGRPGSSTPTQMLAAADVLKQLRKAACNPANLTKG